MFLVVHMMVSLGVSMMLGVLVRLFGSSMGLSALALVFGLGLLLLMFGTFTHR